MFFSMSTCILFFVYKIIFFHSIVKNHFFERGGRMQPYTPDQVDHKDIDPHFISSSPDSKTSRSSNNPFSGDTLLLIILLLYFLSEKNQKNK